MPELIPTGITRLLLVEGEDDKGFFDQLIEYMVSAGQLAGDLESLKVLVYGGRDNLTNVLRELVKAGNSKNLERIGIARDSDHGTDAFRSVQDRIRTVNERNARKLPVPSEPLEVAPGTPSIAVLILPSSDREGALERLVFDALASDPVGACVDEYFECLADNLVQLSPKKLDKAKVRVFLIGQIAGEDSDIARITDRLFLSNVYETKVWQDNDLWNSTAFADARTFLRQLVSD